MEHDVVRMYNHTTGMTLEVKKSNREGVINFLNEGIEWLNYGDTVTIKTKDNEIFLDEIFNYI